MNTFHTSVYPGSTLKVADDAINSYLQGASGKSVLFLNACIYPCNGRTRLSKVPLETYRSQEDFDVFHVSIGHSEPSLEQFD